MKIVIDIPDGLYHKMTKTYNELTWEECMLILDKIEKNSAPLPKGHGRLIDESQIHKCGWDFVNHHAKTDAPTIIEADSRKEDE